MVDFGLEIECSNLEENIRFLWCSPFSVRQDTGSGCQQTMFLFYLCHQVLNFTFISGPDNLFNGKNTMDNLVEGVWDDLLQWHRKSKGFEKTNMTGHETSRQPERCLSRHVWSLRPCELEKLSVKTCFTALCFDGVHCISYKTTFKIICVSDSFLFYHVHIPSIDGTCVWIAEAQGCTWNREIWCRKNTRILYTPFPPQSSRRIVLYYSKWLSVLSFGF